MAKEDFVNYRDEITNILYRQGDEGKDDSLFVTKMVDQLYETAKVSKNKKWILEADYFVVLNNYHRNFAKFKEIKQSQIDSIIEIFDNDLQKIIRQAKKINAFDIELRALYFIWCTHCWNKDYNTCIRYGAQLDKKLSAVPVAQFPDKALYYTEMGKFYYSFYEYEKAKSFFEKGIENATIAPIMQSFALFSIMQSLNSLGLIYRNQYNDLENSDAYFHKILEIIMKANVQDIPSPEHYPKYAQDHLELWEGLAKGNLGTNHFLRGDYENAIPLLLFGMEKAATINRHNFPYAIVKALTLSEIFITKKEFKQAKQYIDKAYEWLEEYKKQTNTTAFKGSPNTWEMYHKVTSLYYHALGNDRLAFLHNDSAVFAQRVYEEEYNLHKLFYAEQLHKQQELDKEIELKKMYYFNFIIISTFAFLLIVFLVFYTIMYRKKRIAYRMLVRKSREWAQSEEVLQNFATAENNETFIEDEQNGKPTENDRKLFEQLNHLFKTEQLYRDPNINLDKLAKQMAVNKNYLSRAINRCTGKNFSTYINEFRIKEAILLLSKNIQKLSLEGIAFETGFNDRRIFYRAFKKVTGLSPSEFRRVSTSSIESPKYSIE